MDIPSRMLSRLVTILRTCKSLVESRTKQPNKMSHILLPMAKRLRNDIVGYATTATLSSIQVTSIHPGVIMLTHTAHQANITNQPVGENPCRILHTFKLHKKKLIPFTVLLP